MNRFADSSTRLATWVTILAVLALGVVIFRDFLFGDKIPLYVDMGGDSADIFYPYHILHSEYLRQLGMFSWSFQVGMGQNLFPSIGSILLSTVILVAQGHYCQGHRLPTFALCRHLRSVIRALPCCSRPDLWEFPARRGVALFLRVYVHGKLLVFPCHRSRLLHASPIRCRPRRGRRLLGPILCWE